MSAATLLLALAGAVVPTAPGAAPRPSSPRDVILSDETTFTTWTVAARRAPIRASPAPRARPRGRLRWATPDGFQQTYLLLRERIVDGEEWILLRIPGRPNGRVGWVRGSALGSFRTVHTSLLVDREASLLTLYRHGRAIFRAPVGTGKPTTPTPPGHPSHGCIRLRNRDIVRLKRLVPIGTPLRVT